AEESALPFPAPAFPAALPKLPAPPRVLARFMVPLIESASADVASSGVDYTSLPGTAPAALNESIFLPFLDLLGAFGTFPACADVFATFFGATGVDSSGALPLPGSSCTLPGLVKFVATSASDFGSAVGGGEMST